MSASIIVNDSNSVLAKGAEYEFTQDDLYVMFGSVFRGLLIMTPLEDLKGNIIDFKWVFCTQRTENLFGQKIIGRKLSETFPTGMLQGRFEAVIAAWKSGIPYSTSFQLPVNDVLMDTHLLAEKFGSNLLVSITDLNYRLDLKESEERFRFMAESIPHIVFTATPDGAVDYSNQKWAEYTGLEETLAVDEFINAYIHPEEREEALTSWRKLFKETAEVKYDNRVRGKDGQYRWFQNRVVPLKNEQGEILKWFGTATDIHDEKTSLDELLRTRDDLELKNRTLQRLNQDLDSFVYTASHDLTAPIANLSGLTNLLAIELRDELNSGQLKYLEMMHVSISRLQDTVFDLTRKILVETDKDIQSQSLVFKEVFEEVLADLAAVFNLNECVITSSFEVETLNYASRNLYTILYNLLSNAIKYADPERQAEVHVASSKKDNLVVLTVSDAGLGIDPSQIEDLFTFHNRLKPGSRGGYGLYMTRRIIENHGGSIHVQSESGRGSHFEVRFSMESTVN